MDGTRRTPRHSPAPDPSAKADITFFGAAISIAGDGWQPRCLDSSPRRRAEPSRAEPSRARAERLKPPQQQRKAPQTAWGFNSKRRTDAGGVRAMGARRDAAGVHAGGGAVRAGGLRAVVAAVSTACREARRRDGRLRYRIGRRRMAEADGAPRWQTASPDARGRTGTGRPPGRRSYTGEEILRSAPGFAARASACGASLRKTNVRCHGTPTPHPPRRTS
jgi:hypothetical protein